ncbi:MAG: hypothetical protein M3Q99_08075 [Acidobacteriota bacterium]|nr:hypothetical protein [Acidobacteriota bacterium]
MKIKIINRVVSAILVTALLGTNLLAQLQLGPQRLVSMPAPTLRNRTRLATALPRVGRPRLSFVGKVGGVAFDSEAKPANGVVVNTISLNYLPNTKPDGERLSITVNGRTISAPIYDWQLVPTAKFANSDSYSCFTLFGDLNDPVEQTNVLKRGGRILNYHQDFVNTLMGLRLFQLDNLVINPYSYELPKDASGYVLGAGESAPDIQANQRGLLTFVRFQVQNKGLFDKGRSYVISDRDEPVSFDLRGNKLNLYGEPSYYFWRRDEAASARFRTREGQKQFQDEFRAELQALYRVNPSANRKTLLIPRLLTDVDNYENQIGDYRPLISLGQVELVGLLSTKGATPQIIRASRRALLNQQSLGSLENQLMVLRLLTTVQQAIPVPELSEKVSKETAMLRAINPAVWDAGVTVMQYAAFFRYCKRNYPQQWNLFMRQISRVRTQDLKPSVITPTIMEPPSRN